MLTDRSPGMGGTKTLLLVVCSLFTAKVSPVQGQTLPTFDSCPSPLVVPEDSEVGSTLFSLRARANGDAFPANNLTFTLESDSAVELVNVTSADFLNDSSAAWPWSADVILRAPLDRDFEPSRRSLAFGATDSNSNTAVLICILNIGDVNDNAPSFQGLPFDIEVSEMMAVGSTLWAGLSASDPDTNVGGQVFLQAEFTDSSVAQTFNTTTSVQGSGQVMDIVLAQPLDYEARTFYTFNVRAVDGGSLNTTAVVRVTVNDAQDTPPVFLLDTYRAALTEHQPVGTPIITISAVDGDSDPPNGIIYSIVQGRADYFTIDPSSGALTSLVVLDRDNGTMVDTDGVFRLTVRATETADVQPQYGNASTEVEVVVVEDINDHPPTFSRVSPYTAFVREDMPLDALIYFDGDGYISVSDADQGRNSHFNLTVERDGVPWAALAAAPTEVYSEALVLLRVMGTDVFKEAADTHISFQLVAREVSTAERHSSTAEVVITVQRLPEPSPTPAPADDDSITTPDIIVFVIGFLVVFNVAATAFIIWFIRRRSEEPRQGVARRGSKYYVNGVEKESRRSSGLGNGSAVSLRSESVLVEVEAKDRCDVVPLGAVPPDARASDPASIGGDTVGGHSTDRKALLHNEVSPAKSAGVTLNASLDSMDMSQGSSRSLAPAAVVEMPNFSKAKRNVSSPKNPALNFSGPALNTASSSPALHVASTATPASGPGTSGSSGTPSASGPGTSGSSGTPSASAESLCLEPVTRFSAQGPVSTTTVAAVSPPASSNPASVSSSTSRQSAASPGASSLHGSGSMAEILY